MYYKNNEMLQNEISAADYSKHLHLLGVEMVLVCDQHAKVNDLSTQRAGKLMSVTKFYDECRCTSMNA